MQGLWRHTSDLGLLAASWVAPFWAPPRSEHEGRARGRYIPGAVPGTIGIGGRGGVPGALSAAADAPGVAPAVVTPGFRGKRRVVPGAVIPGVRGGQGGSNKSNNAPTILARSFTELCVAGASSDREHVSHASQFLESFLLSTRFAFGVRGGVHTVTDTL